MSKKLVAALVLLLVFVVPAAWGAAPLDGKSFQGELKGKGKSHGDKDTFVFADGKFRSAACDKYGYDSATYTAVQSGDSWNFTAETHSPKYGTMSWKGTIKGNAIEGTATRTKDGKPKGEQVFAGTLK